MSSRTYLGLLPWVVFVFVARVTLEGVAWGGVAAAITAGLILLFSARAHSVKLLEVFAVVLFTGFAVAGALNQHQPHGVLQRYHSAFATGALAAFALASIAIVPFTEPYARELVRRKYWATARFKHANLELTLMWAVVFAAITASQTAAGAIDTRLGATLFDWILPVPILLLGVKQASLRWSDQFDGEAMGLDAVLNQVEFWETPLSIPRES